MSRLTSGITMVLGASLALGASLTFTSPATAHAAPAATAATQTSHFAAMARPDDMARPDAMARPDDEVFRFTGDTYPGTAAGLAACQAQGKIFEAESEGVTDCELGEPDAGRYGLYMVRTIP